MDSEISEEALAGKGRSTRAKITCRNCLGNPKVGHSWDKHCRLYLPGKTHHEMRCQYEKDKATRRKPKAKAKPDPSKPSLKAKVLAKKPVPGDSVLKESASGSRPEPLESREQAEAESGLPDKPPVERELQAPSDVFQDDESWEKARDNLPEQPLGVISGIPEEQEEPSEPIKLPIALRRIHDKLRDPTELYKLHLKHHHMSLSLSLRREHQLCRHQRISMRPMAKS